MDHGRRRGLRSPRDATKGNKLVENCCDKRMEGISTRLAVPGLDTNNAVIRGKCCHPAIHLRSPEMVRTQNQTGDCSMMYSSTLIIRRCGSVLKRTLPTLLNRYAFLGSFLVRLGGSLESIC